jgi:hypothetical protein
MNSQQSTSTQQTVPSIDPYPLIEHGAEPVSIILAIAVLISILIGSMTGLVRVMMLAMHQSKSSR